MNFRFVSLAAAVGAAVGVSFALAPTAASAKDDPTKVAADRDALKKEYLAAKKFPFMDLSYYVDSTKLKDSRWEIDTKIEPGPDPDQGTMFRASFPSGNPTDTSPSISFRVYKCIQQDSAKNTKFIKEFKNWGKTVDVSNTKQMAEGYYWDWYLGATDPVKSKCHVPEKKTIGVADWWGCAVGTDKESKKRVKMDWFVWVSSTRQGSWHWNVECETAEKFIDVKEWGEKIDDLMKNIEKMNDPRAHK